MSGNLKYLDDTNFDSTVAKGVTLVDFYADWCGPCRMIAPIINELADEYQGKVTIAKLDIDKSQNATAQHGVTSIPTIMIFKDGKKLDTAVGVRGKESYKMMIDSAL